MTITRHPYRGEADLPRILDLVNRMPFACRHVIDLPWRLSSPTMNTGQNAVFWTDATGNVVGFAAWQYYWAALDLFILPGSTFTDVITDLFAWADKHFLELDTERGWPLPYWIEFRDDDLDRRQLALEHGFTLDEEDHYVLLQHPLRDLLAVPSLPDGFLLRLFKGEQEVAAYAELQRAAFESTSMTAEWRARTLRMPQYRSDLDLVIEAPDGSLVGFCVGWFEPTRKVAQVEPIGVHPRFQQFGLGRILLLAMLHRFKAHGADSAIVETNLDRTPARAAYKKVGFQQVHTIRHLGKWMNQP
ncbi:N-acetyltransferase [Dictyobacter vulcani]|uniref:N-acetyltransferase n=1 Tax=Dictyobacter vulcani TaxID=2607529 RepID=A0A5J4KU10_9CHLR|nr:GNAT family N-acetyltransferase [Dictyobacter vulcani]GER91395.1 N-acetyltransferase [Dictyobacter vulcani]